MRYQITTLNQLRPILQGLRKTAGKTQADVAAFLGITQQTYAQFEANPQAASLEKFFTVVQFLGGSIDISVDAKKKTLKVKTMFTPAPVKTELKKESWRTEMFGLNDVNPGPTKGKFATRTHKKIVVKGDW